MSVADRRKWWVLIALALSALIIGIDLTVLNVALPTLAPALHASTTDLQWFVDTYSLVLAAAVLPAGQLGDRFGRKRLLLIGLTVFDAASAACAYAPNSASLIVTRAVLGLAAAAVLPLSMSVLTVLFDDRERPKAVAAVVSASTLSYPLGPVLGG
jgi:MFS transporter, DHA2 family, multidrug resistance protein